MKKLFTNILVLFFLLIAGEICRSQSFYEALWQGNIEIVQDTLNKHPELANQIGNYGLSPIQVVISWGSANHKQLIDILLEKGADINLKNNEGKTALHYAVTYTSMELIKLLLSYGAEKNVLDKNNRSPLYYAIIREDPAIIDFLFSENNKLPVKGNDGINLLHSAASCGHINTVNNLIAKGADILSERSDGGSLLHSISEGNLHQLIKPLLSKGADINKKNQYHFTPLHLSVISNNAKTTESLLINGADVNIKDNITKLPFHYARENQNKEILSLLKKYNTDESPYEFKISGEYLGQKPPGPVPEIFAPGLISTQQGFEFAGVFTPDGKEYYFTQRGLGFGQRIRFLQLKDNYWSEPGFASFYYDAFEFEPGISPDGQKLFYGSRRPLPGKNELNQSADIWVVNKNKNVWSEPEFFSSGMMYVTVADNGSIYYTGPVDGIFKREFINGKYNDPVGLGENINFMPGTAHPFIAPDESYLIFDAQPYGYDAGSNLFISFKKTDGTWTKAKNMGETINFGNHMCAYVSYDGKYLFYHSSDEKYGDIYWVDAKIIEKLKSDQIK